METPSKSSDFSCLLSLSSSLRYPHSTPGGVIRPEAHLDDRYCQYQGEEKKISAAAAAAAHQKRTLKSKSWIASYAGEKALFSHFSPIRHRCLPPHIPLVDVQPGLSLVLFPPQSPTSF